MNETDCTIGALVRATLAHGIEVGSNRTSATDGSCSAATERLSWGSPGSGLCPLSRSGDVLPTGLPSHAQDGAPCCAWSTHNSSRTRCTLRATGGCMSAGDKKDSKAPADGQLPTVAAIAQMFGWTEGQVTRLVEAAQLGYSVAEAVSVAFKLRPWLGTEATKPPPPYVPVYRVTNRDPRLRFLLRIGKAFTPLMLEIRRALDPTRPGKKSLAKALHKQQRFVKQNPVVEEEWQSLAGHGVMIGVFVSSTASSLGMKAVPISALDVLVAKAGVHLPPEELPANSADAREREKAWRVTMKRAEKLRLLLTDVVA